MQDLRDYVSNIWYEEKALDGLQFVLDLAGLVPGFGEVADGSNALISLARGEYIDAALSALAMIPFVGWGATAGKGVKYGLKAADAVDTALKYSDEIVDVVDTALKYSDEAVEAGDALIKNADDIVEGAGDSIKAGCFGDLPSNVKNSYNGYEGNGWKGNYSGQAPGTNAGRAWGNELGDLPTLDHVGNQITYKEFDANNRISGTSRDAERFLAGSDGSIYYTPDHYGTFIKIK